MPTELSAAVATLGGIAVLGGFAAVFGSAPNPACSGMRSKAGGGVTCSGVSATARTPKPNAWGSPAGNYCAAGSTATESRLAQSGAMPVRGPGG